MAVTKKKIVKKIVKKTKKSIPQRVDGLEKTSTLLRYNAKWFFDEIKKLVTRTANNEDRTKAFEASTSLINQSIGNILTDVKTLYSHVESLSSRMERIIVLMEGYNAKLQVFDAQKRATFEQLLLEAAKSFVIAKQAKEVAHG